LSRNIEGGNGRAGLDLDELWARQREGGAEALRRALAERAGIIEPAEQLRCAAVAFWSVERFCQLSVFVS
jgi:hypothetical protein